MTARELPAYAVYDHPKDFPDKFVGRRFLGTKPTEKFFTADTLDEVRAEIAKRLPGSVRIDPFSNDDPVIVEVWI